jgi:hypothetical protein
MMDWTLHSGNGAAFTWLLVSITLCFMLYWFTVEHEGLHRWLKQSYGEIRGAIMWFVGNKVLGIMLFGVVSTLLAVMLFPRTPLSTMGLTMPKPQVGWPLASMLTGVLILVSWNKNRKIARTHQDFGRYPEIDIPQWSKGTIILHVILWSWYLLAYEFMFRGVLLFISIEMVGFPMAVGINIALYGLAHVPKGMQEAIGALVLGYVLCVLTYASGSVFFAWVIHCALAITNGLSAFHYRQDMHFERRRSPS